MCTNGVSLHLPGSCGLDHEPRWAHGGAHLSTTQEKEAAVALQFIGIDNGSGQTGSPTVWVDTQTADVVIQSYLADEETRAECVQNTAPGHAKGIPDHEGVLRVPGHLI